MNRGIVVAPVSLACAIDSAQSMDTAQKIVTQTPLAKLWNANGPLDARRAENLGETSFESTASRLPQDEVAGCWCTEQVGLARRQGDVHP